MRFEWDEEKAIANEIRHGVRFEDARWAFADAFGLDDYDESHSDRETRFQRIGMAEGTLVTVVYTMRRAEQEEVYRLISAWPATRRERRVYEKGES